MRQPPLTNASELNQQDSCHGPCPNGTQWPKPIKQMSRRPAPGAMDGAAQRRWAGGAKWCGPHGHVFVLNQLTTSTIIINLEINLWSRIFRAFRENHNSWKTFSEDILVICFQTHHCVRLEWFGLHTNMSADPVWPKRNPLSVWL